MSKYDLIIIGGGASGLGTAIAAIENGLKPLVLEQNDFASGTSSKSTKLVHGGIRYLAQGKIKLVTQALRERKEIKALAPHLVENQAFLVPYRTWFEAIFYGVGLKLYDFLSGEKSLGDTSFVSKDYLHKNILGLNTTDIKGAIKYYDAQFDDARLAICLAQTVKEYGGTVLNYSPVIGFKEEEGKLSGVVYKNEDGEEFTAESEIIVNATGVFTEQVEKLSGSIPKNKILASRGSHIVLPLAYLAGTDAIVVPKTKDGRIVFAVPWQGSLLVGTTDIATEEITNSPKASNQEVEFILETIQPYLKKEVSKSVIKSVFSGLRPLTKPLEGQSSKQADRSHKVSVNEKGLFTITGGKWTTFRAIGSDVIEHVKRVSGIDFNRVFIKAYHAGKEQGLVDFKEYGDDRNQLLALIKENAVWGEKLHPDFHFIKAQVIWAVRNEFCKTPEDFLARRIRILFLDVKVALEMCELVTELIAIERQKDNNWIKKEKAAFEETALTYMT